MQSTTKKKRGRPHTSQTKFCTGGRLFALNYPPHIDRPKIPRHNFAIYRYFFRHITGQKKTPFLSIFIVLYLEFIVFSFFRRHNSPFRLLLFASCFPYILPLVHNQTEQKHKQNTMKTFNKVVTYFLGDDAEQDKGELLTALLIASLCAFLLPLL
jgi:hypothetical protein